MQFEIDEIKRIKADQDLVVTKLEREILNLKDKRVEELGALGWVEEYIKYDQVLTELTNFVEKAKFEHLRINDNLKNLNSLMKYKEKVYEFYSRKD